MFVITASFKLKKKWNISCAKNGSADFVQTSIKNIKNKKNKSKSNILKLTHFKIQQSIKKKENKNK